ncbi:MAG: hypothetical protein IPK04_20045 [Bdellovibrionales bacterium]|nr:hypothetical protein [Bdellovibrionales bacterium]
MAHVEKSCLLRKAAYRKTQVVERLRPTKLARDNGFYPKKPKSSTRDRDPKDWIIIAVPQIVSEEDFEKQKRSFKKIKSYRREIINVMSTS